MKIIIREDIVPITKRKPTHPGVFFRETYLKELNLSVTKAAQYLGITRKTLSMLINEKQSLSPEMALRIAKATQTTPESWLEMQERLDLWKVMQRENELDVKLFPVLC